MIFYIIMGCLVVLTLSAAGFACAACGLVYLEWKGTR